MINQKIPGFEQIFTEGLGMVDFVTGQKKKMGIDNSKRTGTDRVLNIHL